MSIRSTKVFFNNQYQESIHMHKQLDYAAILAAGILAISAGFAFGQLEKKESLAVSQIVATDDLKKTVESKGNSLELNQIKESLYGAVNHSFGASDKFTIVSRQNLKALMEEQALSGSAKITGANYILIITIEGFEDYGKDPVTTSAGQLAVNRTIHLSGTAEIQNMNSEVLASPTFDVTTNAKSLKNPGVARDEIVGEDLLVSAARLAANQIAGNTVCELSPPEVMAVSDNDVTIDWAKGMPIVKGDMWEVCALGEPMTNKNGRVIFPKKVVGNVTIQRVDADSSTGLITNKNSGIAVGCILRKPQ
jgi:hypothetical protein